MKTTLLYVHGKGGSPAEAEAFRPFCQGCDLHAVDYASQLPWIAAERIRQQYDTIAPHYDNVVLLTNSIGTLFAMLALQTCRLTHALCISPILDMERLILDMMGWAGVTEQELTQKKEIPTSFGETLSYEYLTYIRTHPIHWRTPTSILYAAGDTLTSRETVDAFALRHQASVTVDPKGEHWYHTPEQLAVLHSWFSEELRHILLSCR